MSCRCDGMLAQWHVGAMSRTARLRLDGAGSQSTHSLETDSDVGVALPAGTLQQLLAAIPRPSGANLDYNIAPRVM